MSDRDEQVSRFVSRAGWGDAIRAPLAGDASGRRYHRLSRTASRDSAILMVDAPTEDGGSVAPFVGIATYLRGLGFSAPEIIASDQDNGFLLLEDLGDDLIARVLETHGEQEIELYALATDALAQLHRHRPPELPLYGPRQMAKKTDVAFEHYLEPITGNNNAHLMACFQEKLETILKRHFQTPPVLVLRDYHAENLLILPDRTGIARLGMLDFQDAVLGHTSYDLVSLLQDVRRDVGTETEERMIARYLQETQGQSDDFRAAYAVQGVQRNLRLLGVLARLTRLLGKPRYVDLIPRAWELLNRGLEHPVLAPVADMIHGNFPEPDSEVLGRLKKT